MAISQVVQQVVAVLHFGQVLRPLQMPLSKFGLMVIFMHRKALLRVIFNIHIHLYHSYHTVPQTILIMLIEEHILCQMLIPKVRVLAKRVT